MNTVTLGVAGRAEMSKRFAAAMRGQAQGQFISFATPELLFQTLTQLRWNILKVMTGAGALSIREVARRVERDVKRVHEDVSALLKAGVFERTAEGGVIFPYDAIHVDFTLQAQAA
ncbi:transcriptional regulator [Paraburkholderia sacchari]|uniref:HVO_A0114 family putative DNA-binding protein n=1 Tax=Paraburkholderia sacchari TaxID=159450 RepID=UPI000541C155|nr:transcriptional regulator [Paraburkholderia sacchari]NLP63427.1 transcriptional regulator [Paraburkholderia sacchari]